MKGSLFPLCPLFSRPIFSSCQGMDHQNRGNRDPLNVFLGEVTKAWEGPYFPYVPYFQGLSFHLAKAWTTKMGEIGTLSWFWHFTLRENRGNRDPLNVFPWWSAKTMKGSLFPLLWWPISIHPVKTWTPKIGEIREIVTLGFGTSLLGKIGEIRTLSIFSLDEVPKPWKGPYFPYFGGPCLDKMTRHGPPK